MPRYWSARQRTAYPWPPCQDQRSEEDDGDIQNYIEVEAVEDIIVFVEEEPEEPHAGEQAEEIEDHPYDAVECLRELRLPLLDGHDGLVVVVGVVAEPVEAVGVGACEHCLQCLMPLGIQGWVKHPRCHKTRCDIRQRQAGG